MGSYSDQKVTFGWQRPEFAGQWSQAGGIARYDLVAAFGLRYRACTGPMTQNIFESG
ncbi:MAG: hypothetical protein CM15mP84_10630 [Cellvibrionales bacterium]|nr:MAG: hypothetical protein CM15mP84_10630 [Cellvibrionales bacterium]